MYRVVTHDRATHRTARVCRAGSAGAAHRDRALRVVRVDDPATLDDLGAPGGHGIGLTVNGDDVIRLFDATVADISDEEVRKDR